MTVFTYLWEAVRYLKPIRTFWQALSGLLVASGAAAVLETSTVSVPGLEAVNWVTILSASVLAGVASFASLMAAGDSLWSEDRPTRES